MGRLAYGKRIHIASPLVRCEAADNVLAVTTPTPAPGWYPDPSGAPQQRYFDGATWTGQTAGTATAVVPPPKQGNGFAIAALVLGIIACCLGLIPILGYFAFPLAAAGLALGIIAINRSRKAQSGKGMAITGTVLCALGLVLATIGVVIVHNAFSDLDSSLNEIAGNSSEQILQKDLDVELGQFAVDNSGVLPSTKMTVKLTNKSSEAASFNVQIEAVDSDGSRIADDTLFVQNLGPGQSIDKDAFAFVPSTDYEKLKTATFRVASVSKY